MNSAWGIKPALNLPIRRPAEAISKSLQPADLLVVAKEGRSRGPLLFLNVLTRARDRFTTLGIGSQDGRPPVVHGIAQPRSILPMRSSKNGHQRRPVRFHRNSRCRRNAGA